MNTLLKTGLEKHFTNLPTIFKKSVHFLYKILIRPRSKNEDFHRRELILNIILTGTIALLLWSEYYVLVNSVTKGAAYSGTPLIFFSVIVIGFIVLHVLSRLGHFIITSYILIFLYFISVSYAVSVWGISLPAGLLAYALIIVISSILISSRFGLLIAGLIVVMITIIGSIEIESGKIALWKQEAVAWNDIVQYSIMLFLLMLISWLSNREIEKSLIRARKSEHELKRERDNLEKTVEERTRELKQTQMEKMTQLYRFAEFGRLSSGIFHDLINPLTTLSLNINELEAKSQKQLPEIKDHLSRACTATKKMESYLDIIRKQIQNQTSTSVFSLNTEIEQAIDMLSYKAQQKGVAIRFNALEDITVSGNSLKFHQIIVNLVSNAIDSYDFTDCTTICIVDVLLVQIANRVRLTVADKGSGIDPKIRDRIFDPFFTTKFDRGMGLGLSTTKHIIEKEFNGTVHVESEPKKGSVFTVEFELK